MKLAAATALLFAIVVMSAGAAAAPSASQIVVTTGADVANGDTATVAGLLASPGPDGISLREAIEATNNDPGTYTIAFANALQGATIALDSQLPPLSGGGVTIEGDINGDGKPDVTLSEAAGFSPGYCAAASGCGLAIASSGNHLHALTLVGFVIGVDIEPWHPGDESLPTLPTHQTLSDNVVSGLVMHGIQGFGVLIDSVSNQNCGLFAGHAQPCSTDDSWANTTITGNTIDTSDTGDAAIAAKIFNAGDRVENTTVTDNTIVETGNTIHDAGIGLEVLGSATGATISGGLISGNSIDGNVSQGINVAAGSNRAQVNTVEGVQVTDNRVTLATPDPSSCCEGIVIQAGSDGATAIFPNVTPVAYPDGNVAQNIVVRGNTVTGTLQAGVVLQAGLGAGGASNKVQNVQIQHNTVTSTTLANGVVIWTASGEPFADRREADNQIAGVDIEANRIRIGNAQGVPPSRAGGVLIIGGGGFGLDCSVSNVQIVNDVIGPGPSQVLLIGGAFADSTGNQVAGVQIVNDTIVNPGSPVLQIIANDKGSSGNSVSAVTATNDILSGTLAGEVTPVMIHSSIVAQAGFATANGNLDVDPKFVDATNGDFHLRAGSPAIGAGSSKDAPATDFDGRTRSGHVDIGAYAFAGTVSRKTYAVSVAIIGKGRVTSTPAGVSCPSRCAGSFAVGTTLRLSATPAQHYQFAGWRRDCTGSARCTVTITGDELVSAVFRRR